MSQILPTLAIAFVLIAIALLAMGIGYFFGGRKKCLQKQCGINPDERKQGCDLCKHEKCPNEKK
ncbi:MAG: hypothetical protein JWO53_2 [Chlamydiia bacterium]|nr:hypothetical protein [Chlamydiia bacterium]